MDLHESPVTACLYVADCAPDLIPAFYSVGSKQKKTGFSERVSAQGTWREIVCKTSSPSVRNGLSREANGGRRRAAIRK